MESKECNIHGNIGHRYGEQGSCKCGAFIDIPKLHHDALNIAYQVGVGRCIGIAKANSAPLTAILAMEALLKELYC